MNKLPNHVAIVMDGNGRWAKKRMLPRIAGHKAGSKAVKKIIDACIEEGIQVLTLWAFSTENWGRPKEEVGYLMRLLLEVIKNNVKEFHSKNIKFMVIGDVLKLPIELQVVISDAENLTKENKGLKLSVAINYSGRWDIAQAMRKLAVKVEDGVLRADSITEEDIKPYFCLSDLPPLDLFIRTSGEMRLSNFALWQLAYTELYFTDVLWPDFNKKELKKALVAYEKRERRFGVIM